MPLEDYLQSRELSFWRLEGTLSSMGLMASHLVVFDELTKLSEGPFDVADIALGLGAIAVYGAATHAYNKVFGRDGIRKKLLDSELRGGYDFIQDLALKATAQFSGGSTSVLAYALHAQG